MNLKQAQAILSDLLMKCEEQGVALPQDPLESITEAIECLRGEMKHEICKSQLETALGAMKTKYGFRSVGRLGRQASHEKRKSAPINEDEGEDAATAPSPRKYMRPAAAHAGATARGSTHSPTAKKHQRIQDEITATPTKRPENQRLVDQLVQLGEYELHSGHSQRGIARMRAAKQLHDTVEVIKSGAQAKRLDRIGVSAAEKIDVLLAH
uniref:Crossover junction endonuclease MUS81-like HHH domain-containing protein n=1 Tax=Globisporangium ultimum (strain ATCC 200006 / CBS 805.95 / DAOM BR144) TaxID=431595 RepID=K3WG39_GLOUD